MRTERGTRKLNSVQLIGNISTDIDLKATASGKFVAKFNLAVTNPFNREKTSFLPIEIWGKNAENTSNYCVKGSKIGVVGYIEVEQWEHNGQNKYKTKVVASSIEFLTPKNNNQTNVQSGNQYMEDPFAPGSQIDISDDLPF